MLNLLPTGRPRRSTAAAAWLAVAACTSPAAPRNDQPTAGPLIHAVVSVASFSATVDATPSGAVYHASVTVREESGRSGATVSLLTFTLPRATGPLTVVYAPSTTPHLAAGRSLDLGVIDVADTAGVLGTASLLSVAVSFTDDVGQSGSVSGQTAVARPLNITGAWDGTATDSQGSTFVSWALTQTGTVVSGTVRTRAVNPNDGSCSSCHRSKSGTFTGTVSGSTVTLTMFFAAGESGDPTPACSATLTGSASSTGDNAIVGAYSGADTCEGPFESGALPMVRHP